jgi:Uncharacterized protein conserved in bacteria
VNRSRVEKRTKLGLAIIAGVFVASISRSGAQVFSAGEFFMPSATAKNIFAPTLLPKLSDENVAPEDTPIKNRFWPEYQPHGLRAGPWIFYPRLSAGAAYDSNVLASADNPQADAIAHVGASLRANSLWERHGIDLQWSAGSRFYKNNSALNQTNANFAGSGHFDIDHSTQLLGAFSAAYLHEELGSLNSPTGAVKPLPYSVIGGDVTLRKEFGRLTTAVGTAVKSYNFGSTVTQNGSIVSQDAQDGQIYWVHGRIDYAFSEKFAVFTAIEGNWRDLRGTPSQSLSSNGYRALAGVDLEVTHLIKGEVAAGYMHQHFFAPTIGDIEGPAFRATLTWSPSRLVDISFIAEQVVTQTADTTATGVRADVAQTRLDYEFRPNVIVSTAATYEKDHFQGQPREDNVYAVDAGLKYLMNNVIAINFQYRYTRRDSNIPQDSFKKHLVGLNASARF